MKEVLFISRRDTIFVKFFSDSAKNIFKEGVRKINESSENGRGCFLKIVVNDKPVPMSSKERYLEISKEKIELSTLEYFFSKYNIDFSHNKSFQQKQAEIDKAWEAVLKMIQSLDSQEAYYTFKEYDCIYAKNPADQIKIEAS